jgi:methanogenic corrinoid protein MtbC1
MENRMLDDFVSALLGMNTEGARAALDHASGSLSPLARIESLVVPALEHIGREWEAGRAALSQVYMSGRICEDLVDTILPRESSDRRRAPAAAICVLLDHHMLGKRIVYSLLRAAGYEIRDYGRATVEELARKVPADGIEILLVSVLMLPSALRVRQLREALDRAGCRAKIVVGGAPFRLDPELWKEVKADAMGTSASEAVELVRRMAGARS